MLPHSQQPIAFLPCEAFLNLSSRYGQSHSGRPKPLQHNFDVIRIVQLANFQELVKANSTGLGRGWLPKKKKKKSGKQNFGRNVN